MLLSVIVKLFLTIVVFIFALLLVTTRYDVSGIGQDTRVARDRRTAEVLPLHEQEFARVDQHLQRNHGCNAPRVVKDLSLPYFRSKLIQHFDIAFKRNEIQWPGRRNQQDQIQI
jgi:hypothetical protein